MHSIFKSNFSNLKMLGSNELSNLNFVSIPHALSNTGNIRYFVWIHNFFKERSWHPTKIAKFLGSHIWTIKEKLISKYYFNFLQSFFSFYSLKCLIIKLYVNVLYNYVNVKIVNTRFQCKTRFIHFFKIRTIEKAFHWR